MKLDLDNRLCVKVDPGLVRTLALFVEGKSALLQKFRDIFVRPTEQSPRHYVTSAPAIVWYGDTTG